MVGTQRNRANSMRLLFGAPKTHVFNDGKEKRHNFTRFFSFIWTYEFWFSRTNASCIPIIEDCINKIRRWLISQHCLSSTKTKHMLIIYQDISANLYQNYLMCCITGHRTFPGAFLGLIAIFIPINGVRYLPCPIWGSNIGPVLS